MSGVFNKIATLLLVLLMTPNMLCAAGTTAAGESALKELSSAIGKMSRYELKFSIGVAAQIDVVRGHCLIDGERYMLDMSTHRIYGDSEVRYTIDVANQEVVVEVMESTMPMIVVNPAAAFVELDRYFDAEVVREDAEVVTLRLSPKQSAALVESVTLSLGATDKLPREIVYLADGDEVRVVVESIEQTKQTIPPFNKLKYPDGYEVIDLR